MIGRAFRIELLIQADQVARTETQWPDRVVAAPIGMQRVFKLAAAIRPEGRHTAKGIGHDQFQWQRLGQLQPRHRQPVPIDQFQLHWHFFMQQSAVLEGATVLHGFQRAAAPPAAQGVRADEEINQRQDGVLAQEDGEHGQQNEEEKESVAHE